MNKPCLYTCAIALLLCSCQIQVGENIRTSAAPCTVAVVMEPTQQQVYRVNENLYAMEVAQWQATRKPPLVKTGLYLQGEDRYRYWKKTGKTEWIARYRYSPEQPWLTKKLRHKPNLAGATKLPLVQVDSTLRSKSNFATRDEYPHQKPDAQPSTKQILLAAPFDYLFDPVVSVAGTSLWLAGVTVGEIIASPVLLFQQNSEPEVYQLSPTQEPIPDDWE